MTNKLLLALALSASMTTFGAMADDEGTVGGGAKGEQTYPTRGGATTPEAAVPGAQPGTGGSAAGEDAGAERDAVGGGATGQQTYPTRGGVTTPEAAVPGAQPGAGAAMGGALRLRGDRIDAFAGLDGNNDAYVSREEARAVPGLNREFSKLDADNDGRLSLTEFAIYAGPAVGSPGGASE